jgi:DNA-binding MarR family transcriptional regulator
MNYCTADRSCKTLLVKRPSGAALLLSQVGSHVAAEFARRLEPLGLTPSHVGILRVLALRAGISQQELAAAIGAVPSRVVKLLDELGDRGLVERRRSTSDRRHHELHLSPAAVEQLTQVLDVVREHDAAVTKGLSQAELKTLLGLLGKVADAQGIDAVGHPGFGQ